MKINQIASYIFFAIFLWLWLIPISYTWLMRKQIPALGNHLNELYRVSCLFTHKASYTWDLWLQIKFGEDETWKNVDYDDFSSMDVFGWLNRLRWIYDNLPENNNAMKDELGKRVAKRFADIYPWQEEVAAVKFVVIWFPADESSPTAHPVRWYIKPAIDTLPEKYKWDDYIWER